MYSLYSTPVELNTRLATAPQPVFQYNTLLASLAINSPLRLSPILSKMSSCVSMVVVNISAFTYEIAHAYLNWFIIYHEA
jgi:hypothetical protein